MKKLLLIIASSIFLVSCYSPVPLTLYKDSYRDRQVESEDSESGNENEYVVVTKGNNLTSVERVSDYALLRAAQLMKEEGFKYFVVSKEVKDFAVGKAWGTEYGQGYVATGLVDVRNPVSGLLVTGYDEKPTVENRKSKVYKTSEVLEELEHYVDEERPKKFNAAETFLWGILIVSCIPLIWVLTIL